MMTNKMMLPLLSEEASVLDAAEAGVKNLTKEPHMDYNIYRGEEEVEERRVCRK
jgi:hypothetical protein